jgi:hypothetical protein
VADLDCLPYGYAAITQIAGWTGAGAALREQWRREACRLEVTALL